MHKKEDGSKCQILIDKKHATAYQIVMTSNLLRFIFIIKAISHYFPQFIYKVFKEPVVLEKCIMATSPVHMKYQFKLYPFLSLYSTILY